MVLDNHQPMQGRHNGGLFIFRTHHILHCIPYYIEAIPMTNRLRNHDFYTSKRWQHKRAMVMRRYSYEDQEAKRYGKTIPATMIHHIYPLKDYPELGLQAWNLLPLSAQSHNQMHDRLTDEITAKGRYWQRKRKREFEAFYRNPPTN